MRLEEFELLKQGYHFSNGVYFARQSDREVRCTFHANGNLHACVHYNLSNYSWNRDPNEGPAYEVFFEDGFLCERAYFYQGRYHRDITLGPAHEYRIRPGGPLTRQWFHYNKLVKQDVEE